MPFKRLLLFAFAPAFALLLGGLLAIFRNPKAAWRSAILHFAAGVIFSVVAVELLPDIVKRHDPVQIVIGFTLGIITMLLIRRLTERKETAEAVAGKVIPIAMLVAIGVDIMIDGLVLGIGFAAGEKEGIMLALALSIELFSLGIAMITELKQNGATRLKAIAYISPSIILFFVTTLFSAVFLKHLSEKPLEIILSFGLSALMFLVTEELLVEAHEEKESAWLTSAFFFGFLLFLIIGMLG